MKEPSMAASEFKAKCLKVLDDVAATGDALIITKRGRPIAKLTPLQADRKPMMGRWEGKGKIKGDLAGFNAEGEWESAF
jgi:prevent-host-death family protein